MTIAPARREAFRILLAVESSGANSSSELALAADSLEPRDRTLCHDIVLNTLRRQMLLDARIQFHSKKSIESLDREVLTALRMAVYQLDHLDRVPPHAIVNDAVSLVAQSGKRSAKGLVNAVLRNLIRRPPVIEFDEPVSELSVLGSHPRWLVEKWIRRFGEDDARLLIENNNSPAPASFRFTARFDRLDKEEQNSIRDRVSGFAALDNCPGDSWKVGGLGPELRDLADGGLIYFQDRGSQRVAEALGARAGETVLDLCASPGSKATQVARSLESTGGLLVACDVSPWRIDFLRVNCLKQEAFSVCPVRLDATVELPFAPNSFDRVLVDAPCSGTGTIAGNPEIRYRVTPDSLAVHARKQLAILREASKAVKPGGFLLYSTCSLEQEENEDIVAEFLSLEQRFETVAPRLEGAQETDFGCEVIFPREPGSSGFFAVGFVNRA